MPAITLKKDLSVSGLTWPGLVNVLARLRWDEKVEKVLLKSGVPTGKKEIVGAITAMVEEAADFARDLREKPEDHFAFVEQLAARSTLGIALARDSPAGTQVFENLFFSVVMARHRYLEDCFEYDKEPIKEFQLSALAKAIDKFNDEVSGFWSNTELELYMNEAADDIDINDDEDNTAINGQQEDVEMEDVRAGVEAITLANGEDVVDVDMMDVDNAGGSTGGNI
ncbi:hypothetical protein QBC40DRAFT_256865 [Triangularia verruculosa]|uniref:Uncharacterized protein n=1 Tax=Triangularia verruculosa TaxID=2587418 RepID=A0AAN6XH55_9PEZI|nr:hypothetical protein QBC40DRAFT_256865 [Triangularia verruculosa]